MKKIIFYLFIINLTSAAFSQENDNNKEQISDEMITDRPDATESPNIVIKGALQIETGIYYSSFEEEELKFESWGYNTTLLRYGLLENFEIRLGWNVEDGKTIFKNDLMQEDITSGFSPLLLGMKIALIDEEGIIPQIGLMGHLNLPFLASSDYKPEHTSIDFRFAFSHTLSENSSFSYNLGAQWGGDSSEASYIYTASYGYAISNSLAAFIEFYGDLPEDNKSNHNWDAGITYLISKNIQLDAAVGKSITEGQDIIISSGISFRIPK
jgi:hypothetical protein